MLLLGSGDVTVAPPLGRDRPKLTPKDFAPIRRMGRPTKCTPAVTEKIVQAIGGHGAYIEQAVAYAGVGRTTYYLWMKKGHEGRALWEMLEAVELGEVVEVPDDQIEDMAAEAGKLLPYVDFLNAVEEALAISELRDLRTITTAARSDWRAAAWRLERKNPSRWGRRDHVEVSSELSGGSGEVGRLEIEVVSSRELSKEEFLHGVGGGGGEVAGSD